MQSNKIYLVGFEINDFIGNIARKIGAKRNRKEKKCKKLKQLIPLDMNIPLSRNHSVWFTTYIYTIAGFAINLPSIH